MTLAHGVTITESPTAVRPAATVDSALAVYTGTSPLVDATKANVPVLCSQLSDFTDVFGVIQPSDEWANWTLHEAAYAHFSVYGVRPIVCISVLDPDNTDHTTNVSAESQTLDDDGEATLDNRGALVSTLVVKVGIVTKTIDTDYTVAQNDDGEWVVTRVSGGTISAGATLTLNYTYLDPTTTTAAIIIGGYSSGAYTGLEVIEQVYPRLRRVPGLILAPAWSQEPTVAARMAAIAASINGAFKCEAITDLDPDIYEIATYADAAGWKSDNGYDSEHQIVTWPKWKTDDGTFHLSTQLACIIGLTDETKGDGLPFWSPSNQSLTGSAPVHDDDDETEVFLSQAIANDSLNAQGIVTAINTFHGWRTWGNYTGAYPGDTDPKDAWIPVRRMNNHLNNVLILTVARDVDAPGNRRLIQGVVGTVQLLLNSWIARGAMLAGSKVEFLEDDNPTADLLAGTYRFRVTQASPIPAQEINFIVEYDTSLLSTLFE